jgi:hypothetical protein
LRFVVSHISRKTSEIWGTQGLFAGTECKFAVPLFSSLLWRGVKQLPYARQVMIVVFRDEIQVVHEPHRSL